MARTLIWDLPTRLFHWLLAAGFIAAAAIALGLGDDSPLFPFHAIIGLLLALIVAWRVAWGFFGSRHARFASFLFGPAAVIDYAKGVLVGGGTRHAGHNPGSSLAIFVMLALPAALAFTGVMMSRGGETWKDIHELCAYAMLATTAVHVAGVLAHTLRHRENITAGMIHGRKDVDPREGIGSSRPIAAAVFLSLAAAWTWSLVRNYDAATRTTTVPLIGATLQLGESNETGHGGKGHDDDD